MREEILESELIEVLLVCVPELKSEIKELREDLEVKDAGIEYWKSVYTNLKEEILSISGELGDEL